MLWTPGDWNAFFGFGTNILVNMLVLTGLLRFVLKMPDSLVFGRILPALGLMMCLSTFYYAFLAYRLAQKTGRTDVCALPSGVSVPHMFIVTFVIMLPVTLKTGDPMKGWSAGLVWVFFQSFILMIGGFVAPLIRKITPRAALLGTLAGVSVTFISMRPALEMYMTPQIGLVCFAIILVSWFGGVKYPRGIPAGLVAIAAGMIIAWGSNIFGLGLGGLSVKGVGDAFANFGFSVPIPAVDHVFSGFEFLGVILVTAIPFGIYDLVEAMDNVESAEAAGDEYPTTRVLDRRRRRQPDRLPDGQSLHQRGLYRPSRLEGDGRADRLFGRDRRDGDRALVARHHLGAARAGAGGRDLADPALHRHADRRAGVPDHAVETRAGDRAGADAASGGLGQAADRHHAGTRLCRRPRPSAAWRPTRPMRCKAAAIAALPQQGVIYHGLEVMGGGSILAGLILGAIGVFVIERDFVKASAFALTGAVLTFFGFMHGESRRRSTSRRAVALAYAVVAAGLFAASKLGTTEHYVAHPEMSAAPAE